MGQRIAWAEKIGNRWQPNGGQARFYVNDWKERIDLHIDYHNTGNVANVQYGDKNPSNCWFKKNVQGTKVWIGADDEKIHIDYCRDETVKKDIVEALEKDYEKWVANDPFTPAERAAIDALAREQVEHEMDENYDEDAEWEEER